MMVKNAKYLYILLLFMMIINFINCNKENSAPLGPGILLTIDKPPDTWYHLKDFLKENNVKLTFYIEMYQELHDTSKVKMKALMADGHEMAHHTSTHPHSDEYVKQYGIDEYMNKEIFAMTDSMKKDGFNPVTYAYPFGDCTTELDARLLEHFNSLRKVLGTYMNKRIADMDQVYYRYGNIKLFYGIGIDVRYNRPLDEVFEALEKAKNSRQTVSLYCHYLSADGKPLEGSDSHIKEDNFKKIILKAKELGLRFYTASEVSQKKY